MQIIYEKLKGKKVKTQWYIGIVCGYTENRLILALTSNPPCSFRAIEKGERYIEKKYRDKSFRYVFADEKDVYKSNPKLSYV